MSHIGTHLPHPKHRTSTFSRKIAFGRRGWKVTVTSLRRLVHGPSTGQQNWERKCYGISSRLDGFRSKTSTVFGSLRISLVEPSPFCPSVSGSAAKAHWESCWPQWIKPGYWWGFNLHPNGCLKMGHSIPHKSHGLSGLSYLFAGWAGSSWLWNGGSKNTMGQSGKLTMNNCHSPINE
jgi:hypothetical protein